MKKLFWICCLVAFLLCLTACKSKDPAPTEAETTEIPTVTLPLDELNILVPEEETTEPAKPETLEISDWGIYSGMFVEDGSDITVENVPCLLIRNTTDQYLDYGVVYTTIGDKECNFVVTGLPGGGSVWVLEENAQTVGAKDTFTYLSQTVSQLKEITSDERVEIRFQNGELVVTNNSDTLMSQVRVYYKRLHTDGNLFGGITYTTAGENLAPGQSMTLKAGHSTEENCLVVRVECTE